jgi:hypothetical protein
VFMLDPCMFLKRNPIFITDEQEVLASFLILGSLEQILVKIPRTLEL